MTNPKKNGDLMLRVRYDSGAILVGPAIITDEENMLVSLGGAASMLVRRADGSLPLHVAAVEMLSDGSMPEGVESAGIRPEHPKDGPPLTDDMAQHGGDRHAARRGRTDVERGRRPVRILAEPGEAERDRGLGGFPVRTRIHAPAPQISRP